MSNNSANSGSTTASPPNPTQEAACHFLTKLPAEIRERIYIEVFTSVPALLLLRRRKGRKRRPNTIQCRNPIGLRRRAGRTIDWSKCSTGILLTSKTCYSEASKCLYGRLSVIFDKPFSIIYAFLRTVTAPSFECIKRITIQHRTTLYGNRQHISGNELSETAMWTHITNSLTSLESLRIKLSVQEYDQQITPPFDEDESAGGRNTFYSVDQLNSIHWLQPLRAFCALRSSLKRVRVDSWDEPFDHMRASCFLGYRYDQVVRPLPGQTYDNAYDEVCGKWCCFYKALHASMGRAIRDIILGRDEPWAEHLVVLTKYQMFKLDQHGSTGLFKDDEEEARAMRREIS
ncbi:hypothetical protein PRZ48_007910 [Zasmidium cellare]|uniref:DUF7730 domain-containing protein n=1 Tax=Zasmidium cellare TaxID=395010 RepID=A0ABR0EEB6_ZASCE|nr:hypothetical protein PRZ48_007910 [Zasmidium cellare]